MPTQPDIIFIMLDTVRADALGTYGGRRLPNIDGLARKSMVFDNAVAPGTYTLPSHLSIFLGKRPRSIKALMKDNMKNYNEKTDPFLKKSTYVKGNEITLAKHLSYIGYRTALFSNNPFLSPYGGTSSGFSYLDNKFVENKIIGSNIPLRMLLGMINNNFTRNGIVRVASELSKVFPKSAMDRLYIALRKEVDRHYSKVCGYYNMDSGAVGTNERIREYLDVNRGRKDFLFVNYMEGHEGYPTNMVDEKETIQDKWLHMIGYSSTHDAMVEKEAYLKRIEYLDRRVADLLGILKAKGRLDDAYVIIASDHGQAFMEHGQMYHNVFPYNEVVKVPLIISRFEGGRQQDCRKRIAQPFSLTRLNGMMVEMGYGKGINVNAIAEDTVVSDHLGITEVWDTYLLKLIRSRSEHADMVYRKKRYFNNFATAVFSNGHKLIHFYGKKQDELYSMDDASEENDILQKNRDLARSILAKSFAVA